MLKILSVSDGIVASHTIELDLRYCIFQCDVIFAMQMNFTDKSLSDLHCCGQVYGCSIDVYLLARSISSR